MKIDKFKLTLVFLLTDIITKAAAWIFLPQNHPIEISNDISLIFSMNYSGLGSEAIHLGFTNEKTIFIFSFIWLINAGMIIFISQYLHKPWLKILFYFFSFFIILLLCAIIDQLTPNITIDRFLISIFSKLCVLTFALSVLYTSKDKIYILLWSVIMAAGLGNTLNELIPPFGVIDFIYSKSLDEKIYMGIFNLADFMIHISNIGLVLYSFYIVLKLTIKRFKEVNP